jgi:hypothetical protein
MRAASVGVIKPGRNATRNRSLRVTAAKAMPPPRVFAGAAGGNQHTVIAKRVGSHGDLLQMVEADLACAFGRAEVAAVTVGE